MAELILRLVHLDQMSDLFGQAQFFWLQASVGVKILVVLIVAGALVVYVLSRKERARLKQEQFGLFLAPSSLYILLIWLLNGGFVAYHIITDNQLYPQSIFVLPIQVILLVIGTAKALAESPCLGLPVTILRLCLFGVPVYLISAFTANLVLFAVAIALVICIFFYIT